MKFPDLKEHLIKDTTAMLEEGYDSWVPKDDTILLIQSQRDNTWQCITYIQLCDPKKYWGPDEGEKMLLIFQLASQPEDPVNTEDLNNLNIRIFKEEK